MKKVLAICLMMIIVINMSVGVLAAPKGFASSPSGVPAPRLISFIPSNEDCTARLVITPYNDSEQLPQELQDLMNKAFNTITTADDLTKLNEEFAELVKSMKLDPKYLAVGELFDIHVTGCTYHEEHVDFDIVLDAETLSHFVGLLHMNKDGVWEFVSDAKVINNGDHLAFSVDSFSPFAIVVDTSAQGNAPQTGDNSNIHIYAIVMAVSALALIVIAVIRKKNKA